MDGTILVSGLGADRFIAGLILGILVGILIGRLAWNWLVWRSWKETDREIRLSHELADRLTGTTLEHDVPPRIGSGSDEP